LSSPAPLLTRTQSRRIRELLRDKRVRNAQGAFIIEGAKPVYDVLQHYPASIQFLLIADGFEGHETEPQRRLRISRNISSFRCATRTFPSLSRLDSPQGILAVVSQPSWNEDRFLERASLFGVYGEGLQDPANVGAIIRTAAALRVDALWLSHESADVYNPKVVRASAGAVLSLPIFVTGDAGRLTNKGIQLYAAEANGAEAVKMESIHDVPRRLVLAVGNESRGLSARTIKEATCRFTIPLSRDIESLNVAATAAIALYYLRSLRAEDAGDVGKND
jgi:TrmH family RNA methyltransferase